MALKLKFARQAEEALKHIYFYSVNQWGEVKADQYYRRISEVIDIIADNPALGRQHPDLPPRYLAIAAGSHLVIYTANKNSLNVVAILHQYMDIPIRLAEIIHSPKMH